MFIQHLLSLQRSVPRSKTGSWVSSCTLANICRPSSHFRATDFSYCSLFTMKSCFVLMSADCWEKHVVCLWAWGSSRSSSGSSGRTFPPFPLVNRSIVTLQEPDENLLLWFMGCHLLGNAQGPLPPSLPPWIQAGEQPARGWNQSPRVLEVLIAPQGEWAHWIYCKHFNLNRDVMWFSSQKKKR